MRDQIGPYRIHRELGRGGMGVVYAAHDAAGREVALKVLSTRGALPVRRERFALEREALARLSHPNVIPVHSAGEADGLAWFAMPLLSGGSLATRVEREGPLTVAEALDLGGALCDALDAAHGIGILHRDLKPENVLFGSRGEPLLADFGLARTMFEGEALTQSGAFLGSPGYMAPEQARGDREAQGPPSDIYGLGATLYFALTGAAPIEGATLAEVVLNTEAAAPVAPSRRNAQVPRGLDAVVLRCLSKHPRQRYRTPSELRDALATCLAPPARSSKVTVLLAVAALGAIGVGLMAAFVLSGERPPVEREGEQAASDTSPSEPKPPPAVPNTRGLGAEPWERRGLPKLDLTVAQALAEGRAAKQLHDHRRAAMLYEHVARNGTRSGLDWEIEYVEVLNKRMNELHEREWYAEALAYARRVAELTHEHMNPEERGMEALLRAGQFQLPYANAHYLLAKQNLRDERYAQALEELAHVEHATPGSDRIAHFSVRVHLAEKRLDLALEALESCCLRADRADPRNGHDPSAVFRYALARIESGDPAGARRFLEYVWNGRSELLRFLAEQQLKPQKIVLSLQVTEAYDPKTRDAQHHLVAAQAYTRLDMTKEADRAFRRARKLAPDQRMVHIADAEYRILARWGGPEVQATADMVRADEPVRAMIYSACGHAQDEHYEEAAEVGLQAFRIDPKLAADSPLGFELALSLFELDRVEEARFVLDAMLKGPPHRWAQANYLKGRFAGKAESGR